jgi:RHS repeat-associated protein
MTYDVHGNPLTVTDARGQATSFTWGHGHQMLTRSAGGKTTRWTRNALGHVLQVFHPDPTLLYTYTYDAMHRLETVTDHRGGKTLTYSYSAGGLLNFVEDGDGNRTDYVYDGSGRLAEIWAPNGDVVTYVRDAAGRLVEKWMPNGVSVRYAHNGDDTVASVTNAHGSTVVSEHAYTYDGFRNRRTHTETVAGVTMPYRYTHDNLNRLTRVENATTLALIESNGFDILGNRTNRTSSTGAVTAFLYDALNQLTQARQGTTAGPLLAGFVYDANGNLVRKCEGGTVTRTDTTCTGTTVTTLTHDVRNQLTQVTKTGLATQAYAYDDQGRRIQKTVGGIATHYLYNGDDIHATYSSWTSPAATYTHGPVTDDPILRIVGTATHYFHGDGLGSVMALTTEAGAIDAIARYDAWGNRIVSTGTLPIYGYTGREPDETGLIHYRARYYDPSVGRFTQRDPIGLAGGLNSYAYVGGNPVGHVDPSGLDYFLVNGRQISGVRDEKWIQRGSDFDRMVRRLFVGEERLDFSWTGGAPLGVRNTAVFEAGRRLAAAIDRVPQDVPVRLFLHSDGGNVGAVASGLVNRPIDLVVTMGTPVRELQFNLDKVLMGIAISSPHDGAQTQGGNSVFVPFIGNIGSAERLRDGFENKVDPRFSGHSLWERHDLIGEVVGGIRATDPLHPAWRTQGVDPSQSYASPANAGGAGIQTMGGISPR